MPIAAALLWGLVGVLAVIAFVRPGEAHRQAGRLAYGQLIRVLPRIIPALLTAGFLAQIVPEDAIAAWLGADSGLAGILVATLIGGFVPGGPVITFPIALVLYRSGVGTPQLVAFLTAWSVFAMHRVLAYEWPLLGWPFSVTRLAVSLPLPIAAGILASLLLSFAEG
jgi:uncharacterized membrane protein YraQ (UPF0718 family)